MSIIYVLIPIAILLVCIAIAVFFWAVKSNQFDDLERHGHSILFDDDIQKNTPNTKESKQLTNGATEPSTNSNDDRP